MKISELKSGQGKVDVEVKVKSKEEPREFEKYGKMLKVCSAVVSDDSGEIILSLWNDDVDKVKVGDTVKVSNGYVSEFNSKKQLTAGKFGKLEVTNGTNGNENSIKPKKKEKTKKVEMDESDEDYSNYESDNADEIEEKEF